jgi:hypothetical protein
MRYKAAAVALVIALAVGAVHAQGLALCVKPGMLVNAAHVGYKTDFMFIGGGLEFATVGASTKSTMTDSTTNPPTVHNYNSKYDVSLFLPQVAARFFFGGGEEGGGSVMGGMGAGEGGGVVRPYAAISAFYSLSAARITSSDGETTVRDTASERQIHDVLDGNIGGTVAVGGEYFFSSSFSIGGEFGCRMLFAGQKSSSGYEGWSEVTTSNLGIGVVYTALGLNFYF